MSSSEEARRLILEALETIRADRARYSFCDRALARLFGITLRRRIK